MWERDGGRGAGWSGRREGRDEGGGSLACMVVANKTIDPRISTMPGQSMSTFYPLRRHWKRDGGTRR